ncbi:MAG TPA: DNA-binding protein [Candidatus Nitrosotenuis sp.]|nr:DNA-binding protein [Candidatus Nitrosotenuis sp.]
MSEPGKPTDAEEIFAESQKIREPKEEQAEATTLVQETESVSTPQETENISAPSETENMSVPQENENVLDEDNAKKTRDVIFVGTKPIMTYVTATLTQLSTQPVVTIKARGQRITQAVDVSQMIVKRMNTVGYTIKDVRIASDSLLSQDGKTRNVSTIEIDIAKA